MFTRRQIHRGCLALAAAAAGSDKICGSDDHELLVRRIDRSLRRAAEMLVSRQADDGAWRSKVYGPLKDGPSLTAFIAATLGQCGVAGGGGAINESLEKAIGYLVRLTTDSPDNARREPMTYPVYTTAGALAATREQNRPEVAAARAVWLRQLRALQLTEALGWRPADPAYGGWGYSPVPARPADGHSPSPLAAPNLSATAFAVEALRGAGVAAGDEAIRKARVFVERCQNFSVAGTTPGRGGPNRRTSGASSEAGLLPAEGFEGEKAFDDGGFFFLLEDGVRNKAGEAGTDAGGRVRYRSYGSATADGLRALVACGRKSDHPRVVAARRWLVKHFSATEHPGDYAADREPQRPALFYYYSAAAAKALATPRSGAAFAPPNWAAALAESLLKRQSADGSWQNSNVEIREDDPLVATPLAMRALNACRQLAENAAP